MKKIVARLSENSVSILTPSTDNEQEYLQNCHATSYINDSVGRKKLKKEVPEPYLSEILEVWGDEPTVFSPVPDIEEIRLSKLSDISATCNQTIIAGFDLTLSGGSAQHFSLEETDQINISSAFMEVKQGAQEYPYHADGEMCSLFSGQDIIALETAAKQHKLYHTTYGNHLLTWIRRAETLEEVEGIYYGAALPEDLAANMQVILTAMGAVNDAV